MASKRAERKRHGGLGPTRPDAAPDRLLDAREAAARLGLKPSTLYQWAYKRRIPVVKLFGPRGALRFRLSDVEQLIQDSLRPGTPRPTPASSEPEGGAERPEPEDEATEP
jgi:excisionase family DNA binding protein